MRNHQKALIYMEKSANMGKLAAMQNTAWLYEYGENISHDINQAMYWLKRAADAGVAESQYFYANACMKGMNHVKINPKEGIYYMKKAVEQGYSNAICDLGYYYDKGIGVEQNYKKAQKYYLEAVELGHDTAMLNAGIQYYAGKGGIKRDLDKAFELWWKAVSLGNDSAKNLIQKVLKLSIFNSVDICTALSALLISQSRYESAFLMYHSDTNSINFFLIKEWMKDEKIINLNNPDDLDSLFLPAYYNYFIALLPFEIIEDNSNSNYIGYKINLNGDGKSPDCDEIKRRIEEIKEKMPFYTEKITYKILGDNNVKSLSIHFSDHCIWRVR